MKTIMNCLLGPIIFTVVPSMIAACVVFCFIIAIYGRSSVAFCLYCLMGVSSILVRKQVSNWNFCSIFIYSCSWICHSPTTATTKSLELLDKQKYLPRWTQHFYNQVLLTLQYMGGGFLDYIPPPPTLKPCSSTRSLPVCPIFILTWSHGYP